MKEIGKHNYLELFLEFHEGLLSQDEQSLVNAFLIANPELQVEFDALADCYLPIDNTINFKAKSKLKKSLAEASLEENDLLMARFIEADLGEKELLDFNRKIERDPTFKSALKIYQSTRLSKSVIAYPEKSDLKIVKGELMPTFLMEKMNSLNSEFKLKSDVSVQFPGLNRLKQEETKVVPLFAIWRAISVIAASVLLVWMLWPVHNPQGRVSNLLGLGKNVINKSPRALSNEAIGLPVDLENPSKTPVNSQPYMAEVRSQEKSKIERIRTQIGKIPSLLASEISNTSNRTLALPMQVQESNIDNGSVELLAARNQSKNSTNSYVSLTEFARTKLNKSLVQEENPEEGLLLAFLDKTVDRIAENSDMNIDLELKKEKGKKLDHFRFTIGRLEIIK